MRTFNKFKDIFYRTVLYKLNREDKTCVNRKEPQINSHLQRISINFKLQLNTTKYRKIIYYKRTILQVYYKYITKS